uniref:Uncharacterized protein n=1 Tax=Medicago truncatula TaxID=3880 RepID=Q2HV38_MEDTR|nr:hypothetical protein MtrDRAFT_AC148995g27v2 [Medicago truncatula]
MNRTAHAALLEEEASKKMKALSPHQCVNNNPQSIMGQSCITEF